MTQSEILEALKQMTNQELSEIIETASRIMREEIAEKTRLKTDKNQRLQAALKTAIPDYEPGGILDDLWSPDSDDYYDNEEEYLGSGIKSNA